MKVKVNDGGQNGKRGSTSIMYREHETSAKKGSVSTTELGLTTNLQEGVLEVTHDSILGGHLGGKKTSDRVSSNFHWPGVAGDVQRYVQARYNRKQGKPMCISSLPPLDINLFLHVKRSHWQMLLWMAAD